MQQSENRSFLVEPGFKIGVLVACLFVLMFYLVFHVLEFDPYSITIIGAIFEMAALPMVAALLILPIISLIQIFKVKKGFPLLPLLSFLSVLAAILIVVLQYYV